VNESPDFPAVYAYLLENSDDSDSSYNSGLGFYGYPRIGSDTKEVFLKDGNQMGSVRYFVPEARVVNYDKGNRYIGNRYIVELDASGKVRLEILTPPGSSGRKIPEEEYRAVFREMFEEIGLYPEDMDRFEFSHSTRF